MMISSIANERLAGFFPFNPYTFFLALLHCLGLPVESRIKVIIVGNPCSTSSLRIRVRGSGSFCNLPLSMMLAVDF